jgi:hypothetical protein
MRSASCCAPSPSARPFGQRLEHRLARLSLQVDEAGAAAAGRDDRARNRVRQRRAEARRARPRRTPPWRPRDIAPRRPALQLALPLRDAELVEDHRDQQVVGLLGLLLEMRPSRIARGGPEPAEERRERLLKRLFQTLFPAGSAASSHRPGRGGSRPASPRPFSPNLLRRVRDQRCRAAARPRAPRSR